MKKLSVIVLAVLMAIGFGTAANAALTFDVDFWTDGSNPVNNYAQGGPGSGDLGGTFILDPGEFINVDIYFSTDLDLVAASWDLQYSPAAAVLVAGTTVAGFPWIAPAPVFTLTSGSVKYQDYVLTGDTVSGDNIFFGSVLFQCDAPVDVDLVLANYLGFLDLDPANNVDFPDVNLGTLSQVPIPGAVWLLGTGLLGLGGIRRARKE